jgi:hypothetical protein
VFVRATVLGLVFQAGLGTVRGFSCERFCSTLFCFIEMGFPYTVLRFEGADLLSCSDGLVLLNYYFTGQLYFSVFLSLLASSLLSNGNISSAHVKFDSSVSDLTLLTYHEKYLPWLPPHGFGIFVNNPYLLISLIELNLRLMDQI